jgi:mannosyltransferase OCH1-like enzyme
MFGAKGDSDDEASEERRRETLGAYARIAFRKLYKATHPGLVDISSLYTEVPVSAGRIPRRVYQTWKDPALPAVHALGLKRFRRLNPDCSFVFFDDARMAAYMRENYAAHPILDVFERIKIPASKADIWRYCILYREGGIYCDIDSALSIPFRVLLKDDPSELLSFEGNHWSSHMQVGAYADPAIFLQRPPDSIAAKLDYPDHTILNWLLCFEKGNPILAEIIDLIVRHFPFFDDRQFESVWQAVIHATGPLAFTQAVWKWMEKTGQRPNQRGIDFDGQGIFKLPGSGDRYTVSPHYMQMKRTSLT